MGGDYCAVNGCLNNSNQQKHLSFFTIPKDKSRLVQWIKIINREDILKTKKNPHGYRVCSIHFDPSMMNNKRLYVGAYPTLHLSHRSAPGPVLSKTNVETRAETPTLKRLGASRGRSTVLCRTGAERPRAPCGYRAPGERSSCVRIRAQRRTRAVGLVTMQWTNEEVVRLIGEFRERRALWDNSAEEFRAHAIKAEAWTALARSFGCEVAEMRKKMNSLFASHRRERLRVRAGGRSKWFAYSHFSFLRTHLEASAACAATPAPPSPGVRYEDAASHCAFEMPFTPAEKQRRYRERRKNNPEKEAEAKRKDRERYHANKRLIRDLTIREHRAIKKKWRSANARRKDKMEGHYAEEGASDEEQSDDDNESSLRLHHEVIVKDEPPDPPYLASPSSRRRGPPARRPRQLRCHNTATEASPALDRNLVRTIRSVTRAELRRGSGRGRDECDVFGEYIANALRKHDERTRAMIKHAIGNILFEQEMKQYVVARAPPRAAAPDRNPLLLDADHERAPARPDYGL